jgi:hypothetical protein
MKINSGTLCKYVCKFRHRRVLLRITNVLDKSCIKNKNEHYALYIYVKLCQILHNVAKYGRARQATDGNITRQMRFACWINKARRERHIQNM